MTIFSFYALENKASEERKDLFGEVSDAVNADKQPVSATPEDCLGSFFETNHSLELPVLITSGNGSGLPPAGTSTSAMCCATRVA